MTRVSFALFAFLGLFAFAPASAKTFNDSLGRFSVEVPEGWIAEAPKDNADLGVIMVGGEGKGYIGVCLVIVASTPETKSNSQEEINATLDAELNEAMWRNNLKESGTDGDNVRFVSSGARDVDGRRVHHAVFEVESKNKDGKIEIGTAKFELHALPGIVDLVLCVTDATTYQTATADFDTIFNSFRPQRGLIGSAPAAGERSVMTLYAGHDFKGVARVIKDDVSNLASLGIAPASASVAGFGRWEVCSGVNFTGTCRAIGASDTAAPGRTLGIASVRRAQPAGARDVIGVINAMAARALIEHRRLQK